MDHARSEKTRKAHTPHYGLKNERQIQGMVQAVRERNKSRRRNNEKVYGLGMREVRGEMNLIHLIIPLLVTAECICHLFSFHAGLENWIAALVNCECECHIEHGRKEK